MYRRHAGAVYRYALGVLRDPSDAEDVSQTTFLNAYRAFRQGERPGSPHNWLITIAHNVCRQRHRLAMRRPAEVELGEGHGVELHEVENGPTPQELQRALAHLAFNQRAALVMRELEGRSYAEIAADLGVSVSAVEALIFRARRALREQLEGQLSCEEAQLAVSRQMDGALPRDAKGPLRAHLRECRECARFARAQRAQRAAFKGLAGVPLPSSLASLFGGGASGSPAVVAGGSGLFVKAAVLASVGIVATGVGVEGVRIVHELHAAPPGPAAGVATKPHGATDRPGRTVFVGPRLDGRRASAHSGSVLVVPRRERRRSVGHGPGQSRGAVARARAAAGKPVAARSRDVTPRTSQNAPPREEPPRPVGTQPAPANPSSLAAPAGATAQPKVPGRPARPQGASGPKRSPPGLTGAKPVSPASPPQPRSKAKSGPAPRAGGPAAPKGKVPPAQTVGKGANPPPPAQPAPAQPPPAQPVGKSANPPHPANPPPAQPPAQPPPGQPQGLGPPPGAGPPTGGGKPLGDGRP